MASVELNKVIAEGEQDTVCMITEPFRVRKSISSLPRGYKCIGERVDARAAICWSGNTEVVKIDKLCNADCAVGIRKFGLKLLC